MDKDKLKTYLAQIEQALKAGNATEHTHRPALKALLESLEPGVTATNEPKRIKCGAPDYIVTRGDIPLGYIEAKDIGISLGEVESGEQLKRYRDSLANLILTDYLEFRWYIAGEHRLTARLATPDKAGKLKLSPDGVQQLDQLLEGFFRADIPVVNSPKELAVRMAALARLMRSIIERTFTEEGERGTLHSQMEAFQKVLLRDMTAAQFADMYAQTICYGLFTARCNATPGEHFTRAHAAYDLPRTNPFLRKLFGHIAGPELDERIVWAVDDLAELLARSDIAAILENFGKHTRQEDPVVHFYETFLAAYDPKMREARGVYYTPEPVVSYIVRSVDAILKNDFKLPQGLADASKVKLKRPVKLTKKGETKYATIETHKVQILDPATGTGTFLYGVIEQIRQAFQGNKGMWPGYVAEHLLPRIYGFELLMAPYAVAHMKLGLQLRESGYDFATDERLRVYLTNTLEEAHEMTGLPLFTQWLAEEANSAAHVKQDAPIMVVLGNPPYSYESENTGKWISQLIRDYYQVDGKPLDERNPKGLQDDYVKFIRFAQWHIEQTGYGILAFVTNHGYLDNPTFRGMRQSLMQTFDDIYILDLHGNSKKKEKAPDGGKDENVFDIQQGVGIGIFVKRQGAKKQAATVRHAELFGLREGKYQWLWEQDLAGTKWQTLQPNAPFYLFIPQNEILREEYERGWQITKIMPVNSVGIVTSRDNLSIHFTPQEAQDAISEFARLTAEGAHERFNLAKDSRDWQVALAQADLKQAQLDYSHPNEIAYRPFDNRFTYYTGRSRGFHSMPRPAVMRQMLNDNLSLLTSRMTKGEQFAHVFATRFISEKILLSAKTSNNSFHFPLYLYSTAKTDLFDNSAAGGRRPNLAPAFIADFSQRLGMTFVPDGQGDRVSTFGPEDVLHYAYAVFHSPEYRRRYAGFLKIDFPRLPLTSSPELFRNLCALGGKLVKLHLLEEIPPTPPLTKGGSAAGGFAVRYPVSGDNKVENVRYTEPGADGTPPGRVWINSAQYFEGVPPEVWNFHVGGYQVCHKWLKDRKGRQLSYDDLTHYQRIVAALARTIELQAAIDDAIGEWPLQ